MQDLISYMNSHGISFIYSPLSSSLKQVPVSLVEPCFKLRPVRRTQQSGPPPSQKNGLSPKNDFFLEVSCDFRGGSENRFHAIFCNEKYFLDLKNFSKKKISNFFSFFEEV